MHRRLLENVHTRKAIWTSMEESLQSPLQQNSRYYLHVCQCYLWRCSSNLSHLGCWALYFLKTFNPTESMRISSTETSQSLFSKADVNWHSLCGVLSTNSLVKSKQTKNKWITPEDLLSVSCSNYFLSASLFRKIFGWPANVLKGCIHVNTHSSPPYYLSFLMYY